MADALTYGAATGAPGGRGHALVAPVLAEVGEIAEVRVHRTGAGRLDVVSAAVLGIGYLVTAVVMAASGPWPRGSDVAVAAALVVLYGVAYRTEFVAATGSAVPTEPVLVALLVAAPARSVPLMVLAGLVLGGGLRATPRPLAYELAVRAASGWHCLGPVALLWAAGVERPTPDRWPLLLGALALQFAVDAAVATVRCVALGASPARLVAPLRFTFAVDALLAPLALCAAHVAGPSATLVVLAALPVALLRLLARDRNEKLAAAVTLGEALVSVHGEARADPLTALPNRRAWDEALADATARVAADGAGVVVSVLVADVDHLKRVNDALGHDAGDQLLRRFAAALVAVAPEGSVVARLGGDEFGILHVSPSVEPPAAFEGLPERLRASAAALPAVGGSGVEASIGTMTCPPAPTVLEAVRLADLAAATDKAARRASRA